MFEDWGWGSPYPRLLTRVAQLIHSMLSLSQSEALKGSHTQGSSWSLTHLRWGLCQPAVPLARLHLGLILERSLQPARQSWLTLETRQWNSWASFYYKGAQAPSPQLTMAISCFGQGRG